MKDVYTGLDILEQMDFSQLKGKTISILCNQASVNRNGQHLLTLLREVEDVHVLAIFLPLYYIHGHGVKSAGICGKVS